MRLTSLISRLAMVLIIVSAATEVVAQDPCAEFQALVASTYDFKPSKLDKAQQKAKSDAMDKVWNAVETNPEKMLPCLRAALTAPKADQWFRFDASSLLVRLDPTPASKAIQISSYLNVDLDDAAQRIWLETLCLRAAEGFDISNAATIWLNYPNAKYYLPQHAYEVNRYGGAFFILGCMDETNALPILLNLIANQNSPHREFALEMLTSLATPEALKELKKVDLKTVSKPARQGISLVLTNSAMIRPRTGTPKVTRDEFIKAFQDAVKGNWKSFDNLVLKVTDGEKDAVVVLKSEDLPLLRKVRRLRMAYCNQHAIEYYNDFTKIIWTLVQKPGQTK